MVLPELRPAWAPARGAPHVAAAPLPAPVPGQVIAPILEVQSDHATEVSDQSMAPSSAVIGRSDDSSAVESDAGVDPGPFAPPAGAGSLTP